MGTTEQKAKPVRKKSTPPAKKTTAPAQRRRSPAAIAKARAEFEARAQAWLRTRPGRQVEMPQELAAVVAAGVPCPGCGAVLRQIRSADHTVWWRQGQRGHWTAGVTVDCRVSA